MILLNFEEEPMILPGILEEFEILDEPMMLPGVLDEFNNIETTPEPINSEVINDDIPYSSNCLALTIVPDYKMLSIKNIVVHSMQVTYKILFSTVVLNLIKLFC